MQPSVTANNQTGNAFSVHLWGTMGRLDNGMDTGQRLPEQSSSSHTTQANPQNTFYETKQKQVQMLKSALFLVEGGLHPRQGVEAQAGPGNTHKSLVLVPSEEGNRVTRGQGVRPVTACPLNLEPCEFITYLIFYMPTRSHYTYVLNEDFLLGHSRSIPFTLH